MKTYYADDQVTLHHGDALHVLRTLQDASVDAVVTDPPYGLVFMGKAWDDHVDNAQFGRWCEQWARECLRILKPGGYMLAFGGSRTWHRLAAAVEDAGFEIRDSIAWLYGSGFPKSMDVSKAIDKAAGAERQVVGFDASRVRPNRQYESGAIGNVGGNGTISDRSDNGATITAPATEAAQQWQGWGTALKPAFEPIMVGRKPLASSGVNVLSMVELGLRERGFDGEIQWTNGPARGAARHAPPTSSSSTGVPQAAATSAAAVGERGTPSDEKASASGSATTTPHGEKQTASMSAPTTGARQQSYGAKSSRPTEKPAPAATNEPPTSSPLTTSTVAEAPTVRRPGARSTNKSSARDSLAVTESFAGIATGLTGSRATVHIERLTDGTFVWPDGLPEYVKGGPLTVAANVLEWGTGALNIDATRIGSLPDSAGSSRGGSTACTCPSPEVGQASRTPNMPPRASSGVSPSGRSDLPASALAGERRCPRSQGSPGGCPTSPCSCGEHAQSEAVADQASALRPLDAPEYPDRYAIGGRSRSHQSNSCLNCTAPNVERGSNTLGRWPTNVLLDESQAAALDADSGVTVSKRSAGRNGSDSAAATFGLNRREDTERGHNDSGGASRFFPTFHYEAKAPTSERPRDGETAHPTVKPLDLMRWLVRLVTPPGGTVLEPFAGSGTTAEACVIENMRCIAIEREADYLPLIINRLSKPIQIGFDFEAGGAA